MPELSSPAVTWNGCQRALWSSPRIRQTVLHAWIPGSREQKEM